MPHREQVAEGIHVAGFADREHSANSGWIALGAETLLIDLPRGMPVDDYLSFVVNTTRKPVRASRMTHLQDGDVTLIQSMVEKGVARILTSPATRTRLLVASASLGSANVHALTELTSIGDAAIPVEFLPFDQIASGAGACVWVPSQAVLFAGPLIVNGPRAALAGSNTGEWLATLNRLSKLAPATSFLGLVHGSVPRYLLARSDF